MYFFFIILCIYSSLLFIYIKGQPLTILKKNKTKYKTKKKHYYHTIIRLRPKKNIELTFYEKIKFCITNKKIYINRITAVIYVFILYFVLFYYLL